MVNFLKVLDKLLKYLKTDRNTFFTYILTLITAYIVIDRVVEILLMIFTGIAVSYWGPIGYTLAIACPVFAFLFSCSSKYADSDEAKHKLFDAYAVSLYIVVLSMFTQWMNLSGWMLFLSVPNFTYIVTNFFPLVKPAFSAITIYLPLTTFYPFIKWLLTTVKDSKLLTESIEDYGGISLSDNSSSWGPYTCEIKFGHDKETGKTVKIAEEKRFYPMLVAGVSGAGKTSMIFEPMVAQDIDKKYFFNEIAKEMGFTALKTGIATLNCPYTNDYINANFSLNMLVPVEEKANTYATYMKKMIISGSGEKYVYKNLGITYITSDVESTHHIEKVLKAYKQKYNLIDPLDSNSIGLNPFIFDDPVQTSIAISTILKSLYETGTPDTPLMYSENVANQAIENIVILLKEMYPRLHENDLPTLEDLLNCLVDFSKIEYYCEEMKKDEDLSNTYSALINYFERNFYKKSPNAIDMEKYITIFSSHLDGLLRYPGVRNIICNRTNNLSFDKALKNGDITLICTRRGDLGPIIHKSFGLFAILLMQFSILRRPGNEKNRIPHFLYIDEFADFVGDATDSIFTLYRKYRVATVISIQNLAQLDRPEKKHREVITSDCSNKIVFGNNAPEDNEWWSQEIGDKKDWKYSNSYDTAKGEYDPKLGGIEYANKIKYKPGKIQSVKFKQCVYKFKNIKGKTDTGIVNLNFLSGSYKEPKNVKEYNFDKYNSNATHISNTSDMNDDDFEDKKRRPNLNNYHFDDNVQSEVDPIKTDTSDSEYLFDNQDAIVFNFKKNNE